MGDKKVKVPEGMLSAAVTPLHRSSLYDVPRIEIARWILEAALRWLSENPQVPTLEEMRKISVPDFDSSEDFVTIAKRNAAVEWQRRMFLAEDEDELQRVTEDEALSALATYENSIRCGTNKKNAMANALEWLQAYRRGRESK